jgi:hypothetical protein
MSEGVNRHRFASESDASETLQTQTHSKNFLRSRTANAARKVVISHFGQASHRIILSSLKGHFWKFLLRNAKV